MVGDKESSWPGTLCSILLRKNGKHIGQYFESEVSNSLQVNIQL